jgi:hypothetical protein
MLIAVVDFQPFDDVNKRVSRLAAKMPFIKRNLSLMFFADVPQSLCTDAILSVYEQSEVNLLKDVFIWAYGRSAEQYAAVRQSLGEPDPFRSMHSAALRQIVSEVEILQIGALLPLSRHLPPTGVSGVLLERGQLGKDVVTYQELRQCILGRFIQYAGEEAPQA